VLSAVSTRSAMTASSATGPAVSLATRAASSPLIATSATKSRRSARRWAPAAQPMSGWRPAPARPQMTRVARLRLAPRPKSCSRSLLRKTTVASWSIVLPTRTATGSAPMARTSRPAAVSAASVMTETGATAVIAANVASATSPAANGPLASVPSGTASHATRAIARPVRNPSPAKAAPSVPVGKLAGRDVAKVVSVIVPVVTDLAASVPSAIASLVRMAIVPHGLLPAARAVRIVRVERVAASAHSPIVRRAVIARLATTIEASAASVTVLPGATSRLVENRPVESQVSAASPAARRASAANPVAVVRVAAPAVASPVAGWRWRPPRRTSGRQAAQPEGLIDAHRWG
jgi:hypothetical protein